METVGSDVSTISVIESVDVLAAVSVTLATILFEPATSVVTSIDQFAVSPVSVNVAPPSIEKEDQR